MHKIPKPFSQKLQFLTYDAAFSTLNKAGTKNGVDFPQHALQSRSVKANCSPVVENIRSALTNTLKNSMTHSSPWETNNSSAFDIQRTVHRDIFL